MEKVVSNINNSNIANMSRYTTDMLINSKSKARAKRTKSGKYGKKF